MLNPRSRRCILSAVPMWIYAVSGISNARVNSRRATGGVGYEQAHSRARRATAAVSSAPTLLHYPEAAQRGTQVRSEDPRVFQNAVSTARVHPWGRLG